MGWSRGIVPDSAWMCGVRVVCLVAPQGVGVVRVFQSVVHTWYRSRLDTPRRVAQKIKCLG